MTTTKTGEIIPKFRAESPEWKEIEKWLKGCLESARKQNDDLNLSAEDTAALRGEIAFIKKALNLPERMKKAAIMRPEQNRHLIGAGQW